MITLEKFGKQDFDRLINWIDSEELMIQFSGTIFNYPITIEQLEKYLDDHIRMVYKVVLVETGETIGHCELDKIDMKNRSAGICRVLIGESKHRNRGYGKMIIRELIRIAFSEMHLHRLHLGVFDFNHQAIRCYEECGFSKEGLLRDTTRIGNKYWSLYNMSTINNDD